MHLVQSKSRLFGVNPPLRRPLGKVSLVPKDASHSVCRIERNSPGQLLRFPTDEVFWEALRCRSGLFSHGIWEV